MSFRRSWSFNICRLYVWMNTVECRLYNRGTDIVICNNTTWITVLLQTFSNCDDLCLFLVPTGWATVVCQSRAVKLWPQSSDPPPAASGTWTWATTTCRILESDFFVKDWGVHIVSWRVSGQRSIPAAAVGLECGCLQSLCCVQFVRLSSHWRCLCSPGLGSQSEPLPPQRTRPEQQQPAGVRSQTVVCWTGAQQLEAGQT